MNTQQSSNKKTTKTHQEIADISLSIFQSLKESGFNHFHCVQICSNLISQVSADLGKERKGDHKNI